MALPPLLLDLASADDANAPPTDNQSTQRTHSATAPSLSQMREARLRHLDTERDALANFLHRGDHGDPDGPAVGD